MERMPERIDSKFRFVLLAAQRAEQIMRGSRPKVDMGDLRTTRIAMEEVINDLVEWDFGPAPEVQPIVESGLPEAAEPAAE